MRSASTFDEGANARHAAAPPSASTTNAGAGAGTAEAAPSEEVRWKGRRERRGGKRAIFLNKLTHIFSCTRFQDLWYAHKRDL